MASLRHAVSELALNLIGGPALEPDGLSAKQMDERGLTNWVFLVFEIFHIFSGNAQFDPQCRQVSVFR